MVMIGEKPWVKYIDEGNNYGRFVVEPLERGFGTTLGNSLRRVLLSSLDGAAITAIKIDGVTHEFGTLPGVVEDVLQIILNVKEIIIKSHSATAKTIKVKAKGKGEVTAADIEHDPEIQIINTDKVIATLESNGKLDMEMIVERGKGYIAAEQNKKPSLPVGSIPIDSVFTPVMKVNIEIEEVRVGQEINSDRLTLHVWTKGSISPEEAVQKSAQILNRHIEMFINLGKPVEEAGALSEEKAEVAESVLEMSIDDLELSARSLNCLQAAKVNSVKQLLSYSKEELMNVKNFGLKSLNEVIDKLAEYKLYLKESAPIEEEGQE